MCECSASSYCYHHYHVHHPGCHHHHCRVSRCYCHDCCHHQHNFHHHHDHCFCHYHHHHHFHHEDGPSPCNMCYLQYCVYGCHRRREPPEKGTITVKESVQTIENGQTTTKETVSVTDLPEAFSKKLVTSASLTSNKSTPPSSNSSPSTPSPPLPSSSGRGSSTPQASLASSLSSLGKRILSRPSTPGITGAGTFEEDSLKRHNELRQRHGVPALKLSKDLCKYAQEWATKLAQINTLEHRSHDKYGENIFMTSKTEISGEEAVDSWYNEIKDHTFGQEPVSMKTGHFTQVVWRSSTELGIAKAQGTSGTYVVANYDPPGNMMGQYVKNVPAPL